MLYALLPKSYQVLHKQALPLSRWNPGSEEVAFNRVAALEALQTLKGSRVAVVGSEVVHVVDGRLRYRAESWSLGSDRGEPTEAYVDRSRELVRDFVENFPECETEAYFVFELVYLPG